MLYLIADMRINNIMMGIKRENSPYFGILLRFLVFFFFHNIIVIPASDWGGSKFVYGQILLLPGSIASGFIFMDWKSTLLMLPTDSADPETSITTILSIRQSAWNF